MNDDTTQNRAGPGQAARRFLQEETGAITVDWVVLTASIVLLGVAAGFLVTANVPGLANKVSDVVGEQSVGVE